jgi:hypothetical protein
MMLVSIEIGKREKEKSDNWFPSSSLVIATMYNDISVSGGGLLKKKKKKSNTRIYCEGLLQTHGAEISFTDGDARLLKAASRFLFHHIRPWLTLTLATKVE